MPVYITITCLLLLMGFTNTVNARDLSQGYEITQHQLEHEATNGTATINMQGNIGLSALISEPVVVCNAAWQLAEGAAISIDGKVISGIPKEVLEKVTLNNVVLGFEVSGYEMRCDPGALGTMGSEKSSFTVPASPGWDKLFHKRDSYDTEDNTATDFADAETAKQIMLGLLKNGFAQGSGGVRILKASINLWPIKQWLQEKDDNEEEKNKSTTKQADKKNQQKTTDKEQASTLQTGKESDDAFWTGKVQTSTNDPSSDSEWEALWRATRKQAATKSVSTGEEKQLSEKEKTDNNQTKAVSANSPTWRFDTSERQIKFWLSNASRYPQRTDKGPLRYSLWVDGKLIKQNERLFPRLVQFDIPPGNSPHEIKLVCTDLGAEPINNGPRKIQFFFTQQKTSNKPEDARRPNRKRYKALSEYTYWQVEKGKTEMTIGINSNKGAGSKAVKPAKPDTTIVYN
ncbi:MAG: hypothetical protein MI865_01115 [Proteobacteria bacterium]|nr:hypothetical protein [Pseudomonadota bacterium]